MVLCVTDWKNGLFMPDVLPWISPQAATAGKEHGFTGRGHLVRAAPRCITDARSSAGSGNRDDLA